MNRRTWILIALSLALVSAPSCEDPPVAPAICSDEYVYGLEILVVDADTGGPTGLGAIAVVRDGDYVENALCEDRGPLGVAAFAAGERAGMYDITIAAEGYLEWSRENVRVSEDRCHVETVRIVAELEPES